MLNTLTLAWYRCRCGFFSNWACWVWTCRKHSCGVLVEFLTVDQLDFSAPQVEWKLLHLWLNKSNLAWIFHFPKLIFYSSQPSSICGTDKFQTSHFAKSFSDDKWAKFPHVHLNFFWVCRVPNPTAQRKSFGWKNCLPPRKKLEFTNKNSRTTWNFSAESSSSASRREMLGINLFWKLSIFRELPNFWRNNFHSATNFPQS